MTPQQLRQILACYVCKQPLTFDKTSGFCTRCKIRVKLVSGVWHALGMLSQQTYSAKKQYDLLFKSEFKGPKDGSYEILASLTRGKRSVDIACGPGLIERLSPETVGVDFSLAALKQAKKNGAQHLLLADTHALPFKDNAFEVAISAGNLEHFDDPILALSEMARISQIQILIVHRYPPIPFARFFYSLVTNLSRVQHQPIEQPLSMGQLNKMFKEVGLHIVFKGVWTLPFNYGRVIRWLPELTIFPSAWFIISMKK